MFSNSIQIGRNKCKKWSSFIPLLKVLLPKSLVNLLLSKSLVEHKEEIRIFSLKNDDVGTENIFKRL